MPDNFELNLYVSSPIQFYNNDFVESEHPRDAEGKFTDTGAGNNTDKSNGEKVPGYIKSNPAHAVKITGKEFGEFTGDRQDYIKRFKSWYKENLQGKYVNNPILGKVIFTGSALSETTHQNIHTLENLKYISALPELIKQSRDIIKEDIKHKKEGVIKSYRIIGYVKTDSDKRKVEVVILEDDRGNKFYTFDAREKSGLQNRFSPVTAGGHFETHKTNSVNCFYTFNTREDLKTKNEGIKYRDSLVFTESKHKKPSPDILKTMSDNVNPYYTHTFNGIRFRKLNRQNLLARALSGFKTINIKGGSKLAQVFLKKSITKILFSLARDAIQHAQKARETQTDLIEFLTVRETIEKKLKPIIKKWFKINCISLHNDFKKKYLEITGISPQMKRVNIDNLVNNYLQDTTKTIHKGYEKFLRKVGQLVRDNLDTSTHPGYRGGDGTIAEKLMQEFKDLSEKRARFIARDQSAKINTELNRLEQIDAGIEYFMWATVKDSRVSTGAGGHDKLDGKIYKWGDHANYPVIDSYGNRGIPSERPNCRCTALSVIVMPGFYPRQLQDGSYEIVKSGLSKSRLLKVKNAFSRIFNKDNWITVKGNHIKLREGETKAQAVKRFVASKEKYNKIKYPPLKLPKREYGRVMHELNNNLTKEEMKKKITKRLIGDYIYRVKINDFNDYIIFERKLFNDISKEP